MKRADAARHFDAMNQIITVARCKVTILAVRILFALPYIPASPA